MISLNTRLQKAQFLTGLKAGKYAIKDMVKDETVIVLNSDDGNFYVPETGQIFTQKDHEEGIKNRTWIDL